MQNMQIKISVKTVPTAIGKDVLGELYLLWVFELMGINNPTDGFAQFNLSKPKFCKTTFIYKNHSLPDWCNP